MARAMMKVQMEHAMERLSEAFEEILGPSPQEDSNRIACAKTDLVRNGAVKITPALAKRAIKKFDAAKGHKRRWLSSIGEFVRTELDEAIDKAYKPVEDKAGKLWNARHKKLTIKFNEAKDEIILGDVDRALKLIEAFRQTKL